MPTTDTIVACASGKGRSPRAILRVFGEGARELLGRVCSPVPGRGGEVARTVLEFRTGCGGGTSGLPCLVLRYDAPRSYTGEDGFELIVPGNPLVIDRVVRAVLGAATDGKAAPLAVREAEPGEFSARGYLNGKFSVEQAEGIAALIAAQTTEQLGAAGELFAGRTGERYRAWTEELATLLALVEAGIDFTDQEDVVPITPVDLGRRLGALCGAIGAELGSVAGSERLSESPRVVLAGAPNAGKSTLFNALLGRRRAIESPVAGTTRDAIAESLDLSCDVPGGMEVVLVDIAGLTKDYARCAGEIEAAALATARGELERATVVVHCDPTGRFADPIPGVAGGPELRVRTKADLPEPEEVAPGAIGVCAIDGWHLGVLKRAIVDAAWGAAGIRGAGAAWLLPRHRRTLAAGLERLERARADVAAQADAGARALARLELIAGELRGALDVLGELVGRIGPDDVIGRVFATFCIGK